MKEEIAKDKTLTLNRSIKELRERIKGNDSLIKNIREKSLLAAFGGIAFNISIVLILPEIAGAFLLTSSLAYIVYSLSNTSKIKKIERDTDKLKRLKISYEVELDEASKPVINKEIQFVEKKQHENTYNNATRDLYSINDNIFEEKPIQLKRRK